MVGRSPDFPFVSGSVPFDRTASFANHEGKGFPCVFIPILRPHPHIEAVSSKVPPTSRRLTIFFTI